MEDYPPYFIYSAKEYWLWSIPLSIATYCFIRLLKPILRKLASVVQCLREVFKCAVWRSKLWVLWLLILEPAILKGSFSVFNQLTVPFCFTLQDKFHIATAVLFLFLFILYAVAFYLLVHRFNKRSREILLVFGKLQRSGFLVETLVLPVHKILRAAIHSNLVYLYRNKLILFLAVDVLELLLVLRLRRSFSHFFFFLASACYSFTFMALNLVL